MARSVMKKSYFNASIFRINEIPMRFYLEGYDDCQFHEISRIIEAYGGKLSLPDTDTIVFSEPGRYAHTDRRRFHIKCLHDSIVQNKLQDINKYALPWRINLNEKDSEGSPPPDGLIPLKTDSPERKPSKGSIIPVSPPKPNPLYRLRESYVLIRDCASSLPGLLKKQKPSSSRGPESHSSKPTAEKAQPLNISSSRFNATPSASPKTADKPSPIAKFRTKAPESRTPRTPRTPSTKTPLRTLGTPSSRGATPGKSSTPRGRYTSPRGAKRSRDYRDIVESPSDKDDSFEVVEVPLRPVVQEIIEISDTEYVPEPQNNGSDKGPGDLDSWDNLTGCDGPNAYAVWSRAGPPGPPNLGDEDNLGDICSRTIKQEREIMGASPPRTREQMKRVKYDCDTDSDRGIGSSKARARRKRRKKGYEYDRSYPGHAGQPPYTDEENKKMIKYLIDNRAISRSTDIHVWMKFVILKILVDPPRGPDSLKKHFEDQLIFNFEKYTTDPSAVEEFNKVRDKLI